MASTNITLKEAEELLCEFEKAYRNFYQNSDELIILVDERTKAKEHDFYEQASKDSKEFINPTGFSNSWVWGLFFEEQEKNRKFYNPHLRVFEQLTAFYQDHTFIKYDEDKKTVLKKIEDSLPKDLAAGKKDEFENPENESKKIFFQKTKYLIKHKNLLKVIGIFLVVLLSFWAYPFLTKQNLPFKEIKIGNQIWSSEINIAVPDSYCYEDFDKNCEIFGRLYSYKSAKIIADKFDGWELPIMQDYENLIQFLGGDDKAMDKLLKGGDSKFNAILSGYKSDEEVDRVKLNYTSLGSEAAFWTSSIGESKDKRDMNRPYALRIFQSGAWGNICDCWTQRDALSLRLIKTNRGYIEDFVKDSIYLKDLDRVKNDNEYVSINETNRNVIPQPVFKKDKSLSYNILIVPYSITGFNKDIKETKKDFGNLIKNRLVQVHNKENNGVFSIKYLPDFENKYINFSFSNEIKNDFYEAVRKYHNADLIVYETNKIDGNTYSCYYSGNLNIDVFEFNKNNLFDTQSILSYHHLKGDITSITNWLSSLVCYDAGKSYSTKKVFENAEKYLTEIQNLNIENYKKHLLDAKISTFLYPDSIAVEKYNKLIDEKPMLSESYIERAMFQNDKLKLEDINNSIRQDSTFILGYYLKFLFLSDKKENKKAIDVLKILKKRVEYQQQYEYIDNLINK